MREIEGMKEINNCKEKERIINREKKGKERERKVNRKKR